MAEQDQDGQGTMAWWEASLRTPLGELVWWVDAEGCLRAVDWRDHEARMRALLTRRYGPGGYTIQAGSPPVDLRPAFEAYFAGDGAALDALPVRTQGTPFQEQVWQALRAIPAGQAWSYTALARHIGRPRAVRAVGLANGANPISLVIPCHRVIGADGTLTGYGGGLPRKRWLLAHEGALPGASLPLALDFSASGGLSGR